MSVHHRAEHRLAEHMTSVRRGAPSARKAREILHHGTVHGRRLTPRQRRYMGARAGTGAVPGQHDE